MGAHLLRDHAWSMHVLDCGLLPCSQLKCAVSYGLSGKQMGASARPHCWASLSPKHAHKLLRVLPAPQQARMRTAGCAPCTACMPPSSRCVERGLDLVATMQAAGEPYGPALKCAPCYYLHGLPRSPCRRPALHDIRLLRCLCCRATATGAGMWTCLSASASSRWRSCGRGERWW